MDRGLFQIARPVKWDILENFYKNVEGGLEKIDKMKRYCESDEEEKVFGKYSKSQLRYAEVNKKFLFDRLLKLNDEFEWTKENVDKLIRLDQHIRKLETEMYEKFVQIKQDLDSLIERGFDTYKDYQVEAKIDYDVSYVDNEERECKYDWLNNLLQDYADWHTLGWFTFGDGQKPDNPQDKEHFVYEAWGEWLKYDYFVENGITKYLCNLIEEPNMSLYSFSDIVNMDLRCFYVTYDISI